MIVVRFVCRVMLLQATLTLPMTLDAHRSLNDTKLVCVKAPVHGKREFCLSSEMFYMREWPSRFGGKGEFVVASRDCCSPFAWRGGEMHRTSRLVQVENIGDDIRLPLNKNEWLDIVFQWWLHLFCMNAPRLLSSMLTFFYI